MLTAGFVFSAKMGTKLVADAVLFQNPGHSTKGERIVIQAAGRRVKPKRPPPKIRVNSFEELQTLKFSNTEFLDFRQTIGISGPLLGTPHMVVQFEKPLLAPNHNKDVADPS